MPKVSESIRYEIQRQKLAAYRSWHPDYKMQDLTLPSPAQKQAMLMESQKETMQKLGQSIRRLNQMLTVPAELAESLRRIHDSTRQINMAFRPFMDAMARFQMKQ